MRQRSQRSEDITVPDESAIDGLTADSADTEVLHEVPRLRQVSRRGRLRQLDQLVPVVLFLVLYNLGHTVPAILAATGWSVKTVYIRRRSGMPVGVWLPTITAYLIARAAVSIAVEHDLVDVGISGEAVYIGIGIATKMLIGLAVIGTILMGRPLALMAVHWVAVIPEAMSSHPRFVSALRNVTWMIALYEIGTSVLDFILANSMCITYFLITRQILNFVVAFVLILGTVVYLDGALAKVPGWPGMENLLNSREPDAAETATPEPAGSVSKDENENSL